MTKLQTWTKIFDRTVVKAAIRIHSPSVRWSHQTSLKLAVNISSLVNINSILSHGKQRYFYFAVFGLVRKVESGVFW